MKVRSPGSGRQTVVLRAHESTLDEGDDQG
jgi:hypothetical protein